MRIILLATLLAPACLADTLLLTDGTKYDGKVIREQGDDYVVQIQVSRGIRDERVIPKAKIKQIIKEELDIAPFAAIAGFASTPDLLPLKEYDERIAAVEKFLKTYPEGSKRPDAKKILAALQSERDAVATGAIKFDGRVISGAQYAADAYDIDAKVLATQIKRLAQSGQIIPALRKYSEFDKNFSGSAVFNENLPDNINMLQSFLVRVSAMVDAQPVLSKERESGYPNMPVADRMRAVQIVKEEDAEYARRYTYEHAIKEKWLTINPYSKEVLGEIYHNLQQEIQRLATSRSAPSYGTAPAEPGEVFRTAWKTLTNTTDTKAEDTAIQSAQTAHLPERYINMLKQARHN